jgi:hypothetical protein
MNQRIRLSSEQKQQSEITAQHQQASVSEFASPEELLRHDASHTPVPPKVGERLKQSIASLPRPKEPWWRRFFGS